MPLELIIIFQGRSDYSKVYGANMGPAWVMLAPGRPHVGPQNLAIKVCL